ncbi:MAG: DUF2946 domain-containing protein [Bradyrhizobium sp.]|jgi:hypothetical protein
MNVEEGLLMRQRLRRFLPIVLFAVIVQILAPIGACWGASIASSDPLHAAVICHGGAANDQGEPAAQPGAHDGCCSACSLAHPGALVDSTPASIVPGYGEPERIVWVDMAPDLLGSRTGSHAQARAPPIIS